MNGFDGCTWSGNERGIIGRGFVGCNYLIWKQVNLGIEADVERTGIEVRKLKDGDGVPKPEWLQEWYSN